MHRVFNLASGTMLTSLLVLGVYAVVPVPMGDLRKYVPRPQAIAKFYKGGGCGVSSFNHASSTHFYRGLKLTPAVAAQLDMELTAEGYVKTQSAKGISYQKRHSCFMPTRSSVYVRANGGVSCSAGRNKWR